MKFIEFHKEKCDSCYKCLRVCPTKAISFNQNEREIVDDLCIKCGLCQASCPQEALKIHSQLSRVKQMIQDHETIAVSLAPSYIGAFGLKEPNHMVGFLKKIGITYVEETAYGAEIVAEYYDTYIEKATKKNYITSCCPSANYLIEEHFPMLIGEVIPVVSPMIAHGRSMKKRYGDQVKVVFIGPCLAKMAEAEEMKNAVDAVLTFDELDHWIYEYKSLLSDYPNVELDNKGSRRGQAFPLGGSLHQKDNKIREDHDMRFIHVDGIESCKEILNEMRLGNLENCCIEMNICEGSCINGPDMPKNYLGRFAREMFMRDYTKQKSVISQEKAPMHEEEEEALKPSKDSLEEALIHRSFKDKQLRQQEPTIDIVCKILQRMNKFSKKDELNCGACGYKTCYDKAKAIFYGYSEVETCLPYLREKAESMQSMMIENSPNAVVLMNQELNISEVNPSFNDIFNEDGLPFKEMPIALFLKHPIFQEALLEKKNMYNKKIRSEELGRYFLVNIVYLEPPIRLLVFLTDISEDEKRRHEFNRVKEETLVKTQEVINKQMRVAQEIASLLGETTAETKMNLKSLKDLVMQDRGGI